MSEAKKIVDALLEADEIDPKKFVQDKNLYPAPKIKTTFSRYTFNDAEDGDYEEEHGYEDEEGEEFEIDEFDRDDGIDLAAKAARWLRDKGVMEASSSDFHPGVWYSGQPEENYINGSNTTRSFHLEGFTPEEEQTIYHLLFPKKQR